MQQAGQSEPRELRRAEGKGGGKRNGGDDAPAATAAGAAAPGVPAASAATPAAAAAAPAATSPAFACCWLFNDQTKRYQFYPKPANAVCQVPYKLAACPGAKPAAAAAASAKPPPPPLAVETAAAPPTKEEPAAAAAAVVAAEPPTQKRSKFNKQNTVPVKDEAVAPPKKEHSEAKPAATKTKEDGGGGGGGGGSSGGGGGGGFGTFVFLAGVLGVAYALRSKLRAALADYFPDKGAGGASGAKGGKPKRKQGEYKSVGIRDDDTASQTSCGIPEQEIDAATEEWAARIAMQRSGAGPGDGAGCTTLAAGGLPGGGGCGGCGGGAAAGFASPGGAGLPPGMTTPQPSAPPGQEDFGGFGGFDGDGGGGGGGGGAGWGAPQGAGGTPMVGQQGLDGGMGGGGFGGPSQAGASDIDWGMLAEPTAGGGGGRGEDKDDPFSVQEPQEEDDDDFIAFGGFGHDGKPQTKPDAKGAASGMSWDDERKMWNQASTSNPFASNPFGRRGGGGGGSPWDLRSNLGTPTSIKDFRRQAEKVFNDNVSASLFASPSMQRFKRQTDDFLSGVTTSLSGTFSSLATITGVSSVTTGVNSYFKSWFG